MEHKKIAIVSDHAGYLLKEQLVKMFRIENLEITDMGCNSSESVDYPDYGHLLAIAVANGEYDMGISICGTGNGINMTVNKHPGIRSALCWNEEISRLARAHNDANICALPGWYLNESEAYLIVRTFLNTDFEGGRHLRRINKIPVKIY